jgi:predicted membrane-bound mannosyltransferase
MPLPRPASPRALWADLRAFTSERRPHHWVAMALAVAIPIAIIVTFYFDGQTNIAPGPQLIYVESWPASRTDAQIKAQQKIDQAWRDKALKERQEMFKKHDEQLERLGL